MFQSLPTKLLYTSTSTLGPGAACYLEGIGFTVSAELRFGSKFYVHYNDY